MRSGRGLLAGMKRKTARPWRVHLRSTIASFTIAAFLLLTVTVGSDAQAAGKVSRIGYLDQGSAARNTVYLDQLRQGLRELGWVEGQNITIEPRRCPGMPGAARGLLPPPCRDKDSAHIGPVSLKARFLYLC